MFGTQIIFHITQKSATGATALLTFGDKKPPDLKDPLIPRVRGISVV
jgi:hypothetical protein